MPMRLEIISSGSTRIVILIAGVAIKFPSIKGGIKNFLYGMISNITERSWSKIEQGMPTVYFCDYLGLISISKRYARVRHNGLFFVDLVELSVKSKIHADFWNYDAKPENFGYDKGVRLIKIDCGV